MEREQFDLLYLGRQTDSRGIEWYSYNIFKWNKLETDYHEKKFYTNVKIDIDDLSTEDLERLLALKNNTKISIIEQHKYTF